jgi:hypothetical protein
MRSRSRAWWAMAAVGLMVVLGHGRNAVAADATGTWKWTVERNGNSFDQVLTLVQEGETLNGSIKVRDTETPIEDGKVKGDTVTFKVTREFNGNKFVIMYEGKVSSDTIKGQSKVERDGQTQTREWEAKRAS